MADRFLQRIPRRGRLLMRYTRMQFKKRVPRHYFFGTICWLVSVLFVLFQFALQLSSGAMVGGLMQSFHLTAFGAGVLASSYYYVYVSLQTPAGLLVDMFGPRKLLSAGVLCCTSGSLLFGVAHWVSFALLGRLLMGMGGAFAFVGSTSLIARWFPREYFPVFLGILESIGMFVSLLAIVGVAHLVESYGWRESLELAAIIGAGLTILLWLVIRDAPPNAAPASVPPRGQLWLELKLILKNFQAWINALYSGLMYAVVTVFVALWGVPFLQLEHHLDLIQATFYMNAAFLGLAVGCPFMGWLNQRIRWRNLLLCICPVIAVVLIGLVIYDSILNLNLIFVLMMFLGFCISSYMVPFAIGNEIATPYTRSASIGFVNTLSVGTAPIFQTLVGYLLNLFADKHAGQLIYTAQSYQHALLVVPALLIFAAICAWGIPKRPVAPAISI